MLLADRGYDADWIRALLAGTTAGRIASLRALIPGASYVRGTLSIYTTMTQSPPTMIYEPSDEQVAYVAAAFSPDGRVQASGSFPTREAAEAFLQAFMQEKAGEYGLMLEKSVAAPTMSPSASAACELRDRRAGVIQSAKDESLGHSWRKN